MDFEEIWLGSPNYLWFDDELRGPIRKAGKHTAAEQITSRALEGFI